MESTPQKILMYNLIAKIRENKVASWCFAFCIGLGFRYIYGFIKNLLWNSNLGFLAFSGSTSKSQMLFLTILLNFVVEFTSSSIAALICGAVLIYVLKKKALIFSIPVIVVFLALSFRLWNFWKAPGIGLQISILMGPILASLIFAGTTWLFLKIFIRKKKGQVD